MKANSTADRRDSEDDRHSAAAAFALKSPHKAIHSLKAEDCSGDYIFNAQRCRHCFDPHLASVEKV